MLRPSLFPWFLIFPLLHYLSQRRFHMSRNLKPALAKLLSSTTFPTRQMMGGETVVAAHRPRAIEITTKSGPRKTPYRHYIKYKRRLVLVTPRDAWPGITNTRELKHRVRHRFLHATKGWREYSAEGGMLNRMAQLAAHTARQEAQKLAARMPA